MPLQSVWEAGSIHPAALSRPFAGQPLIAPLQDVCNIIRVIPISRDDPDVFYCFSYVFLHFRMIARTSRTTRAAKKAQHATGG